MNFKLIFISLKLKYFITFHIVVAAAAAQVGAAQCPLNELYYNSTLSPICDVNCQDLQRQCPVSTVRPVAGCYCQANYARNLQQRCIPQRECVKDCFPNEISIAPRSKDCENICRTSATGFRLNICYRLSERRCVCAIGYCRNRKGQCVKNSQ